MVGIIKDKAMKFKKGDRVKRKSKANFSGDYNRIGTIIHVVPESHFLYNVAWDNWEQGPEVCKEEGLKSIENEQLLFDWA